MIAEANVHGAISLVNAIATGRGATLGIDLNVQAKVENTPGKGITIESENRSLSSRLICKTVETIVPKKDLEKNKFHIILQSDIPTGYGLKSSSAISSAVALACAKITKGKINDSQVLLAGVDASIKTKVSITGAYDDACACYYGGFAVTDNFKRKLICAQKGPTDLTAIIFIPKSRKRGNVNRLRTLKPIFEKAWSLAKDSDYWNAMILNGFATSSTLDSDPKLISSLIQKGALGASVSGNGPAIAAVARKDNLREIKKIFSELDGRIITSQINNKKAEVHEV